MSDDEVRALERAALAGRPDALPLLYRARERAGLVGNYVSACDFEIQPHGIIQADVLGVRVNVASMSPMSMKLRVMIESPISEALVQDMMLVDPDSPESRAADLVRAAWADKLEVPEDVERRIAGAIRSAEARVRDMEVRRCAKLVEDALTQPVRGPRKKLRVALHEALEEMRGD